MKHFIKTVMKFFRLMCTVFSFSLLKIKYGYKLKFYGFPITLRYNNICLENGFISIGKDFNPQRNSEFKAAQNGEIIIGNDVYVGKNSNVVAIEKIEIGDGTRIGPNVNIFDNNHLFDTSGVKNEYNTKKISIGKKCWLASNVVVLKGAVIGDGCIIGAGSIISGNIPAHSIVRVNQKQTVETIIEKTKE